MPLPRRQFLTQTTLASAALAFAPRAAHSAEAAPSPRFPLIVFNKPFQNLNFDDTAGVIAEVGWGGMECPVRARGQILPESIEDELPRLVEALKKRGLTLEILTSDIVAIDPRAEKVLRTAAKLGGFAVKWCPLGEGMVRREFFDWLKASSYRGPISQHGEYQEGAGPAEIAAMKKDLAALKAWLA